jgi:hypothetical protein
VNSFEASYFLVGSGWVPCCLILHRYFPSMLSGGIGNFRTRRGWGKGNELLLGIRNRSIELSDLALKPPDPSNSWDYGRLIPTKKQLNYKVPHQQIKGVGGIIKILGLTRILAWLDSHIRSFIPCPNAMGEWDKK